MRKILLFGITSLFFAGYADTVGPTLPGTVEAYDRSNPVVEKKPEEYWNLAWHARMADYGDVESQFVLAQAYEIGLQTEANTEKAIYFYDKACHGGHVGACMRLGELHEVRNLDKALMYFNRAAGAGYIPAQLKLVSIYKETYQRAIDVHKIREDIAIKIAKDIEKSLKELGLNCRFNVVVLAKEMEKEPSLELFNEDGIDAVEFNIETNLGEGLKPLAKVVSGGEMSRIMLAIKALFIKSQKISTVIFDEVDTGISGEIARKVALKIYDISLSTQVISITHLPQVASLSDHHIRISKKVNNNRTFTTIKELSLDEKIYEVASLISSGKVTDKQLEYAKEMVMERK